MSFQNKKSSLNLRLLFFCVVLHFIFLHDQFIILNEKCDCGAAKWPIRVGTYLSTHIKKKTICKILTNFAYLNFL